MNSTILEHLKISEKSKIYLVYDNAHHCMAVKKHLCGKHDIYTKLKSLSHPYLPKILDVRFQNNETIITEEYISGGSIAKIKTNEKQLQKWLFELCDALSFLHKNDTLHRDIKPSNLLIGSDGHIRLIDFDAARKQNPIAEHDTRLLGTRGYAPPEQYGFAQTDRRADIYALGITFRELLGDKAKKSSWKHILNRCTILDPKRRYSSTGQIKRAFIIRKALHVILPILFAGVILFSLFMLWSYHTDTNFKDALDIITSSKRDLVFGEVNMDEFYKSDAVLREFIGNEETIYGRISAAAPDKIYISTGYTMYEGYLLFGGFSSTYRINTGDLIYHSFDGLYYMDVHQVIHHIPPEACIKYAPAVIKLYELDIFD